MTHLIGFGNKARQGKDTAAWAIHHRYPMQTRVYGFAEALKAYARLCLGMTVKDPALLQRASTDHARSCLIDALRYRIEEESPQFALITDVRCRAEADWIRTQGGVLVCVRRNGYVADDRDPNHYSEVELDDFGWDYEIVADSGDLDTVRISAVRIFQEVQSGIYRENRSRNHRRPARLLRPPGGACRNQIDAW